MSIDSLFSVWPTVTPAAVEEYHRRLGDGGAYMSSMIMRINEENPALFYFIEKCANGSPDAQSLCLATLMTAYCLTAIQQELDAQKPKN